jgi:hypothetical protein
LTISKIKENSKLKKDYVMIITKNRFKYIETNATLRGLLLNFANNRNLLTEILEPMNYRLNLMTKTLPNGVNVNEN